MTRLLCAAAALMLAVSIRTQAAEVGQPVEVAPKAEGTRNQTWASVAWCEGAKCWLAVWREGYLNEAKSEVWCARIAADGTPMDPAGFRLSGGNGLKDRPRVASDGRSFLVTWEDMRNGKDWDVYAARVSAAPSAGSTGSPQAGSGQGVKVLDEDGFLIAGGPHNQCRPDVAFARGNYVAAWMGFSEGFYGIYSCRVSPEGKLLDQTPATVARVDSKKPDSPAQSVLPALAANRDGELLAGFFVTDSYRMHYLARRPIDAMTGQPGGPSPSARPPDSKAPGMSGHVYKQRTAALAMGPDNALALCSRKDMQPADRDFSVCLLSKTGDALGIQEIGSPLSLNSQHKPIQSRLAAVFDGKGYLLVGDVLSPVEADKKKADPGKYARILGWRVSTDGKLDAADGFAVAGEEGRECLLPAASAGPEGTSLVVYTEVRGVDDAKLLARVIK